MPPPFIALSQSSTCYPAVHPVPAPTVQPAFSSVSLSSAGLKDLIQIESTLSSDSGQTHKTASLPVDSSPNDNKSPPTCSSPSPLGDSDAYVGSSSSPPLPHKDSSGRLGGSGLGGPPTAAQETFSNRKLAENRQLKVTFPSCTLKAPEKGNKSLLNKVKPHLNSVWSIKYRLLDI